MRRQIGKLTALDVKRLGEGVHADGGGLYLVVKASGARSWTFRYQLAGERHEVGFGATHAVGLARARERATEARGLLAEGKDPISARRAALASLRAAAVTFKDFAERHIEAHEPGWRASGKSAVQWRQSLRAYVYPRLGAMALGDIDTADVLAVLTPSWTARPSTAVKVRGRIEAILDAAKTRGLRSGDNPARWKGHLENLLPKTKTLAPVVHFAALDYREVPPFMAELRAHESIKARALEYAILTAGRRGEVLGATWDEIDLEKKLWTVSGARMKAAKSHRAPLSDRAVEIVSEMAAIRDGDYLFAGKSRGKPLGVLAMFTTLRDLGRGDLTAHGFRSSFRDWAGDHGYPRELCEQALAHTIGNEAEQAYRRGDALERRRTMMAAWSAYCAGDERNNVVKLAG